MDGLLKTIHNILIPDGFKSLAISVFHGWRMGHWVYTKLKRDDDKEWRPERVETNRTCIGGGGGAVD
jgi:hypothetical protein